MVLQVVMVPPYAQTLTLYYTEVTVWKIQLSMLFNEQVPAPHGKKRLHISASC